MLSWQYPVAALAVCCGLAFPVAGMAADKGKTHTVVMDGTRFEPETLTVRLGDSVVWINKDPFPHTATARSGAFDSGSLDAGKKWKYKARRPGDFPYYCTLHPTMRGLLRVQ